jgi:hypothetical protein
MILNIVSYILITLCLSVEQKEQISGEAIVLKLITRSVLPARLDRHRDGVLPLDKPRFG